MLGRIIERLKKEPRDKVVPLGWHNPHSFRGYYHDLAFTPKPNATIGEMLDAAESALGATFEGYKGGDYVMGEYAECWFSHYGASSDDKIGPILLEFLITGKPPESVP